MENLSNKPSALNESYDEMMARYNKEQQEKEQELFDQFNVSFFTEDQLYIHSIHFSDEEDIFSSSYVTLDVAFEEQDKPNATILFEETDKVQRTREKAV